jgi:hypothetical protein
METSSGGDAPWMDVLIRVARALLGAQAPAVPLQRRTPDRELLRGDAF